jgi:hypothetical protein
MRKTDEFRNANYQQLRRLLRIINHYENHGGGPSLDWFLQWANGEPMGGEQTTEGTIDYWEKVIADPRYGEVKP